MCSNLANLSCLILGFPASLSPLNAGNQFTYLRTACRFSVLSLRPVALRERQRTWYGSRTSVGPLHPIPTVSAAPSYLDGCLSRAGPPRFTALSSAILFTRLQISPYLHPPYNHITSSLHFIYFSSPRTEPYFSALSPEEYILCRCLLAH